MLPSYRSGKINRLCVDFLLAGCYTIQTYFPAVLEARSPKMRCQQSHAFSETLARILSWIFLATRIILYSRGHTMHCKQMQGLVSEVPKQI